jgi:XTP/dITP diphosphohydrolase
VANNQKLIAALQGKTDRGAHYVCALVMVNSTNDPEPLIVQARWYGQIVDEPQGDRGFGYDPHFFIPELGKTVAQLEPAEKNQISHRGQALRELITQLQVRAQYA